MTKLSFLRWQRLPAPSARALLAGRSLAVVAALGAGWAVLAVSGRDAGAMFYELMDASLGSRESIEGLGLMASPLLLTGLAVALAMRVGAWNIGAEGQFYMGALAATAVSLCSSGWPQPVILGAMLAAGLLGGALWIVVPALARAYAGVSEIMTTLLLNFVALLLVYYVSIGPWRDRSSGTLAATPRMAVDMPALSGDLHWGIAIAFGAVMLVALVLRYSRWGYEVRIVGANADVAAYAGIPVRHRLVAVMLASGALAGLAGMLEVVGTVHRLQGGIANNYGYLGIVVAVLGRGSPLGVFGATLLLVFILNAGVALQTQGLTMSAVLAFTGLVLLFTALADGCVHYRPVRARRAADTGNDRPGSLA